MEFSGHHAVMVISQRVESVPAYEYVDGKRTDRQRVNETGAPIWSVRGVAPFVGGDLVADGSVQATELFEGAPPLGTMLDVEGVFKPRPANSWGLTGTLMVERWIDDTDTSFSTPSLDSSTDEEEQI